MTGETLAAVAPHAARCGAPCVGCRASADALAALIPHAALTTDIVHFDGRDLSQRQMAALYALYLQPGRHTVSTMAAHLHTSRPAVTRIMDRLTDAGLARREEDTSDRRVVLLLQTDAGAAYMQRLVAIVEEQAA